MAPLSWPVFTVYAVSISVTPVVCGVLIPEVVVVALALIVAVICR